MESSDDEVAPVVVFDESSYGIRKKTDASGAVIVKDRSVKSGLIDLDTSNVVPVSKRHVMDAEEYSYGFLYFLFLTLLLIF